MIEYVNRFKMKKKTEQKKKRNYPWQNRTFTYTKQETIKSYIKVFT